MNECMNKLMIKLNSNLFKELVHVWIIKLLNCIYE